MIYGSDEVADFRNEDLIFRYVDTGLFWAILPTEYRTPANEEVVEWVAEEVKTTCVAEILGRGYYVRWKLGTHTKVEDVIQTGFVLQSEVIARMLFPKLGVYQYVIPRNDEDSGLGADPIERSA